MKGKKNSHKKSSQKRPGHQVRILPQLRRKQEGKAEEGQLLKKSTDLVEDKRSPPFYFFFPRFRMKLSRVFFFQKKQQKLHFF